MEGYWSKVSALVGAVVIVCIFVFMMNSAIMSAGLVVLVGVLTCGLFYPRVDVEREKLMRNSAQVDQSLQAFSRNMREAVTHVCGNLESLSHEIQTLVENSSVRLHASFQGLSELANVGRDLMNGVAEQLFSSGSDSGVVSLNRFADEVGAILDDYVSLFVDISQKTVPAVHNISRYG